MSTYLTLPLQQAKVSNSVHALMPGSKPDLLSARGVEQYLLVVVLLVDSVEDLPEV